MRARRWTRRARVGQAGRHEHGGHAAPQVRRQVVGSTRQRWPVCACTQSDTAVMATSAQGDHSRSLRTARHSGQRQHRPQREELPRVGAGLVRLPK
jgi:hypothetical protein